MGEPPRVGCLDTRHPRRLFGAGQVPPRQHTLFMTSPQLTNNTVQDYDPSWSSDGSRVAFWRPRANTNEIFVKNVTDGRLAKLTRSNDSWSDTSPSWSSNGEKIATVCDNLADGRREVCVMNADGSGRKRLTTNSLHEGMVVWSPDGSKIAFDT